MAGDQRVDVTLFEHEPAPQGRGALSAILVDGIFHEQRFVPSCGIAALGSYLRERGFTTQLFAPNNHRMDERQAADWLLERMPDFIGISLLTRFTFPSFEKLATYLRQGGYQGMICVGGHGASISHAYLLQRYPELLDCVVIGDGEETCAHLLYQIENQGDWRTLRGLAYRDQSGAVIYNGQRQLRGLDEYPLIALDLIGELAEMYGTNVRVGVVTSRGCYADCSYCSVKAFTRLQGVKPYRMRSVQKVVDEIELIQQRYGLKNFVLEDDNFIVPGKAGIRRATEFNRQIKERGIKLNLTLQTRPECITYEAISLLKEVGLCDIFIGTESFDQDTLNLYHRNNTVEQSQHAFEVFESLGFSAAVDAQHRVRVGSMVFHPYITLDALYPQAQAFRRYQLPAKKLLKRLRPARDVRLCQQLEQEGLLNEDGEYNFIHPEVANVYQTLRLFYGEYMSIREQIRVIEKKHRLHGMDFDINRYRDIRIFIDNTFLDLFQELCLKGKSGADVVRQIYENKRAYMHQHYDFDALRREVDEKLADLRGYVVNN